MKNKLIHFGLIVNEQRTKYRRCSKKKIGLNDREIDSRYLEHVKSYKYLVSIVNGDNSIEEETTEGIALGSKSYYVNQKIFKSKLVSKKAKLKLYWTMKRHVIKYAIKMWLLKESTKRKYH